MIFDDEKKESIEKKAESLLRRTKISHKTGLQGQRYAPFSRESRPSTAKNGPEALGFQGSKQYYPDVIDLYWDRSKWEAWQMHLDSIHSTPLYDYSSLTMRP